MSCPTDDLDAFVRAELPAPKAAEIAAHLQSCGSCQGEVAWLRTEIGLARRHAASEATSPDSLWSGIASRLGESPRSPVAHPTESTSRTRSSSRARGWAPAVGLVPALAVLVIALRAPAPKPDGGRRPVASKADVALQHSLDAVAAAERDYRTAVDELEAEYRAERAHLEPEEALRWDATLELARTRLGAARLAASADVDGQMKVLRGYSAYVHTLHRAVNELQETSK